VHSTIYFQIDNPVYDPDGDDSVFTGVAVDNNKESAPPVHNAQSEQMLILKEKPYDKKVSRCEICVYNNVFLTLTSYIDDVR